MMKPDYRELQQAYIAELRDAKDVAEAWWQALVASELADSIEAATAEVRRRWPDGAASHPRVIAVVIRYMHACAALNQVRERGEQVPLSQFLLEGLDTRESQDLVDFTDALSYWPINHDASERPV